MKKETIEKTSDGQPQGTFPSEGGLPPAEKKTAIGATTKGSDGLDHMTKANQTTSTGSPRVPVSQDFFDRLGEMYQDGENRLTHALPLLRMAAKSEDLKTLLGVHLEETKGHAQSLEELAQSSGKELPTKTCQPIADLVKEGEMEVIKNIFDPAERDAAIIAAGRKVEQFEISAYTPLCATAEDNDWTHEFAVLTSILNQETLANELLAGLAKGKEPLKQLIEKVSLAHAKAGAN